MVIWPNKDDLHSFHSLLDLFVVEFWIVARKVLRYRFCYSLAGNNFTFLVSAIGHSVPCSDVAPNLFCYELSNNLKLLTECCCYALPHVTFVISDNISYYVQFTLVIFKVDRCLPIRDIFQAILSIRIQLVFRQKYTDRRIGGQGQSWLSTCFFRPMRLG